MAQRIAFTASFGRCLGVALAALAVATTASAEGVDAPEEVILSLRADRYVLLDGFLALKRGERLYLPVEEVAAALTIAVATRGDGQSIEGWIADESRRFRLDLVAGAGEVDGEAIAFDPETDVIRADVVYLSLDLLRRVWPIEAEMKERQGEIWIEPAAELPFLARAKREARQGLLTRPQPPGSLPRVALPYAWASAPSVDLTVTLADSSAGDARANFYAVAAGDLGKMSFQGVAAGGAAEGMTQLRASFGRSDPNGGVFDVDYLTDVRFGDVATPNLPLVGGSTAGLGVIAAGGRRWSVYDVRETVVEGDAPPGYEVELYLGDHVIDYMVVGPDGRYRFEGVPTLPGVNQLRAVIYGPLGEREERTDVAFANDALLPEGGHSTTVGFVGARGSGNLLLDRDDGNFAGPSFSLRHGYGVAEAWTARFDLAQIPRKASSRSGATSNDERSTYVGVGTTFAAFDSLFDFNVATQGGGWAGEATMLASGRWTAFSVTQQAFHDFESDVAGFGPERLRQATAARLSFNLPRDWPLPATGAALSASRRERIDGLVETRAGAAIYGNVGRVRFSSFADATTDNVSDARHIDGATYLSWNLDRFDFDVATDYDLTDGFELRQSRLGVGRDDVFGGDLRLNVGYDFVTHARSFGAGYARDFENFRVGVQGDWNSDGGVSALLTLSTSIGWAPETGDLLVTSQPLATSAPIVTRHFLDLDEDGVRDAGEPPVKGVQIRGLASFWGDGASDADGNIVALLGSPDKPVNVAVDPLSIEDPLWAPGDEGVSVVGRRGRIAVIDLPIVQRHDVEGFLYVENAHGGIAAVRGAKIEILDESGVVAETLTTAFDGAFYAPSLRAKLYTLRLAADDQPQLLNGAVLPPATIDLRDVDGGLYGLEFVARRSVAPVAVQAP